jgi:S1-C subfamily serine protease
MRRSRLAAVVVVLAALLVANVQAAAPKRSPTQGVVIIETTLAYQGGAAGGTGIVLTHSGQVLTNNHVILGAGKITVVVPAAKRRYTAHVVGYDVADDVALLKLDRAKNLATVKLGNSARLRVGQRASAVGNARGAGKLVITTGRITGLRQSVVVDDGNGGTTHLRGLIRTSARLVPGDSGGPLLDAAGRVVGIDSVGTVGNTFQSSGGYAIPINKAFSLVRLIRAGTATARVHVGATAFIGVSLAESQNGLVVGSVVQGSAAEAAGIVEGDVITGFDGRPVATLAALRAALLAHHPGDSVTLDYIDPQGNQTTATLVLGEGPPQ